MSLRGKRAEKKITKHLKTLVKSPDWWVHRLPDAAQCQGKLQKQPADFLVMFRGAPLLLEVKEESRTNKLAGSRLTQLPKMRLFEMAGGKAVFLIYHYEQDLWRLVSVSDAARVNKSTINLEEFNLLSDLREVFFVLENFLRRVKRGY